MQVLIASLWLVVAKAYVQCIYTVSMQLTASMWPVVAEVP